MALSYVTYTGNGSTQNFNLTFPYLDRDHVYASVDGVATSFTFLTSSSIQFASAPASGAQIRLYRNTPRSAPLATLTNGAVSDAASYNTISKQMLYSLQEIEDAYGTIVDLSDAATIVVGIATGVSAAEAAALAAQVAAEAAQAAASGNADAAALAQAAAETAQSAAETAQAAAEAAQAAASGSAAAAASSASDASTSAGLAVTNATAASDSAAAAAASAADAAASAASLSFTKDTDGTMAANSDSVVPSQKAVVTYVAAAFTALKAGVSTAYDTLAELAAGLATKLTASNNLSDLGSASTARTNLGLATVASSGSYTDLSSKPTIGTAGALDKATAAYLAAATTDKVVTADVALSAMAWATITAGSSPAIDHASGVNQKITHSANATMGAPSNSKAGWPLNVWIVPGAYTTAWNSVFKFGDAGAPTITAEGVAFFQCLDSSNYVYLGFAKKA